MVTYIHSLYLLKQKTTLATYNVTVTHRNCRQFYKIYLHFYNRTRTVGVRYSGRERTVAPWTTSATKPVD